MSHFWPSFSHSLMLSLLLMQDISNPLQEEQAGTSLAVFFLSGHIYRIFVPGMHVFTDSEWQFKMFLVFVLYY